MTYHHYAYNIWKTYFISCSAEMMKMFMISQVFIVHRNK